MSDYFRLKSAVEIYKYFLLKITRENTSVVPPSKFNLYINTAQLEWVKSKLPTHQFNQKRIEDLQILHVDTDGTLHPVIIAKGVNGADAMLFPYPTPGQVQVESTGLETRGPTPDPDIDMTIKWPALLHGISAEFKINYKNNACIKDGLSEFLPAKYQKTDEAAMNARNTYKKPKDDRLYFEVIKNYIRLHTGTQSTGHSLRLQYYRYPNQIIYDNDPMKCRDSEFTTSQNMEIVDLAVIDFLERGQDARLNTFSQVERNKGQYK